MSETRIQRDNKRDTEALARLYAEEDSDRGFLARQILRLLIEQAASQQDGEDEQATIGKVS